MRIQWILIVAVFLLTMIIHSDEFQSKGLEPLPSGLGRSMPQAQPKGIVTGADSSAGNGGDINQLPKRIDLSKYLPPVKSQGPISSCSAWSTVYYAKTIQENQERGWGADTLSHQYSPLFTYNQITGGVDRGTSIVEHMILLEEQGVPPLSDFPYTDDISILPNERVFKEAGKYKASSHKALDTYDYDNQTWSVDLQTVKIILADGIPVIGGFQIYRNFDSYQGGIYNRISGPSLGGHAMCIVGYDDDRKALKIVNSWGPSWGENGFFWLSYNLFEELCTYGCAVMYDLIDTRIQVISSPLELKGSKGVYTDQIELKWSETEGTDYYLVYRVDNEKGLLEEISRTMETGYTDKSLPPGVSYVYAVKSGRNSDNSISGFSEIAEGWTKEEKSVPGIPTRLEYTFFNGNPLLVWEPVSDADGYTIYRWSEKKEVFLNIGRSTDTTFLDRSFKDIGYKGIIYYIIEAFNGHGAGFSTDSLAVIKEIKTVSREKVISTGINGEIHDDVSVRASRQTAFDGNYYRTDFFDFEYAMARFREYNEKEKEAFRNFQKDEKTRFEEWKRTH